MKNLFKHSRNTPLHPRNLILSVALATLLGSLIATPALSKDDDNRDGRKYQQNAARDDRRGDRDERREEIRHGNRGDPYTYWDRRDPRDYRDPHDHYRYAEPVYAPPVATYGPPPSVGLSLFFPFDLRRW